MRSVSFPVSVGTSQTTAAFYGASKARCGVASFASLILAHGAGAPQTSRWMITVARAICARGIDVITFNFLYSEAKRRVPDKNAVLETTWRAAISAVRERVGEEHPRLFIGGKSMGGRIATHIAASADVDVAGLVLLGYPLHPPGKPEQLRAAHLPQVRAPMLFVQGSRDAFGTPSELAPIVRALAPGTRLFVVEDGDHSLVPPRSTGETIEAVIARVADEVARFTG